MKTLDETVRLIRAWLADAEVVVRIVDSEIPGWRETAHVHAESCALAERTESLKQAVNVLLATDQSLSPPFRKALDRICDAVWTAASVLRHGITSRLDNGMLLEIREGLQILPPPSADKSSGPNRDEAHATGLPRGTQVTKSRREEKRELHEKAALAALERLGRNGKRPKLAAVAAVAEVTPRTLGNYPAFMVAWRKAGAPHPERLHGTGKRRGRTGAVLWEGGEAETK
ncbi:MAG: hypothetical protein IT452_16250 [Planctomycetia bacterium]|nr:hypothetical protein [Planctomycetia bacterium]